MISALKFCMQPFVLCRVYADFFPGFVQSFIFYNAVNECEKRIVFSQANVVARMNFGSYLPHDNGARVNFFTAIYFDAASLRVGVSSVAGASLTFFMCHDVLRYIKICFIFMLVNS